jgi:hypothetical protein
MTWSGGPSGSGFTVRPELDSGAEAVVDGVGVALTLVPEPFLVQIFAEKCEVDDALHRPRVHRTQVAAGGDDPFVAQPLPPELLVLAVAAFSVRRLGDLRALKSHFLVFSICKSKTNHFSSKQGKKISDSILNTTMKYQYGYHHLGSIHVLFINQRSLGHLESTK